jgi:arylsulfatase A-like enzyme
MIEALDTEIGRFLSFVDWSDTTVLFVADNGAPGAFLQAPRSIHHGKGTVYEPGVRVPLIVAGQAVAQAARGGETAALVQATDIFPTVLELAGHPPQPRLDAVSMAPYLSNPATPPQRETVYTEIFTPNGGPIDPASYHRAARDARYKLVRRGFLPDELYDLELDPYEASPLDLAGLSTAERQAYQRLVRAISPTALSPAVPSVPHAVIPGLAVALLAVAWRLRPGRPRAW